MNKTKNESYDQFTNRIDQAISESEKEMNEGSEAIDLDEAFVSLNRKYYNV